MAREAIKLGDPEVLPSGKVRWQKQFKKQPWKSPAYDQDSRRNRADAWQHFCEFRAGIEAQRLLQQGTQEQSDPIRQNVIDHLAKEIELAHAIGDAKQVKWAKNALRMVETTNEIGVYQAAALLGIHDKGEEPTEYKAVENAVERITKRAKSTQPKSETAGEIVSQYLAMFAAKVRSKQASNGDYGKTRSALKLWLEFFGESRSLDTFDNPDVVAYWTHLTGLIAEGSNQTTLSTYFVKWKTFLSHVAVDYRFGLPSNLYRYTIKPGKSKIETFTIDEVQGILANCSERVELWLLLMLNIGAYQSDIADLTADQVDWEKGRIIRPRSKEKNAPTINWKLWGRTWELLQALGYQEGKVCRKVNGEPLITQGIKADGNIWKRDAIVSSWRHVVERCKKKGVLPEDNSRTLKHFRKTSASLIETSPHGEFVDMFLDHSRVARQHYLKGQIVPKFDKAVDWLGKQLGY